MRDLKNIFKNKKFKVGVIGLGYVGLPLVNLFVQKGIKVIGIDNDLKKINLLKKGGNYISSKNLKNFKYFKKNNENLSTNFSKLKIVDVIIICLPTPLKKLKPDMSYVIDCAKKLAALNLKNKTIILESTVYPSATLEFFKIVNFKNIYTPGKNIFLGYSPERENPGDKNFSYKKTPKIISGYTPSCLKVMENIYSHIIKKLVKAKNIESAEASKLLENLYRAVNIGLVNEFKIICDKLKLDIFEIINLASTKNFGFQKFLPGPGLGGHCIPIDPYYLSWISNRFGYDPKFIKLSGELNRSMPQWVVKKMLKNINKKKPRILLLGISYKKNVDDDRESPAFAIMKILDEKKIVFDYNDPYFKSLRQGRQSKIKKKSLKLSKKNLKKFDGVLIITDHDKYNYKFIAKNSKQVFDSRGVYKKYNFKNIVYC